MPLVLLVFLTSLVLWLVDLLVSRFHPFNLKAESWLQWGNVLGIDTILLILWSIGQARKRLVVEEFVDYTILKNPGASEQSGDQGKATAIAQPQSLAKGLATLLVVRLAQVRELYQAASILEQRPLQTDVGLFQFVEEAINIDDIKGFLKDAVSSESRFSFGFLQIPIGTIMALFARMFRGPRIIGSLHGDGNTFVLTAQRVDDKQPSSWRIENTRIEEGDVSRLDEMITELAYHIFADIELGRSIKWRALRAFTDGLQAYRECLNTPRERILNLRQAERKLLEAVAEDERFALAYYNLGVIYTELGKVESTFKAAAESAFLKAIEENALSWRAYYGLMQWRFIQNEYMSVIQLCDRIIAFKPGIANKARVDHFKGYAQRLIGDQSSSPFLQESIKTRKLSVSRSWRALCIAELKGQGVGRVKSNSISALRKLSSICLVDLAVAYTYQGDLYRIDAEKYANVHQALIKANSGWAVARFFRAWSINRKERQYYRKSSSVFRKSQTPFRQALSLTPANADTHFEFGQMYTVWEKYEHAVHEFKCATQLDPGNGIYWAYLAAASAAVDNDKELAHYACKQAMSGASQEKEKKLLFEKVAEAYRALEQEVQSKRILDMNDFLTGLEEYVQLEKPRILEDKRKVSLQEGKDWEVAQVNHALGKVYFELGRLHEAEKCFRQAIKGFEKDYAQEIKVQGLRAWLARTLTELEEYDEAFQEVEQALALDPFSHFVCDAQAHVYNRLNEFEQAIKVWKESLFLEPYEPDIYFNIGDAYIALGQQYRDMERRNEAFQQSILYFHQALDLYKSDQQRQKGEVRYRLGTLHLERSEYEEAISNFKVAEALHYSPLSSRFYLGYACLQNKMYDEAVNIFRDLRQNMAKKRKNQFLEEEMKQTALLALTNCGLSSALVERGSSNDLKEAEECIKNSASFYDTLKNDKTFKQNDIAEMYSLANYYETQGWMYYKLGKVTEALIYLEKALSLSGKAKTYLRLALAYEYRLHELTKKDELHFTITQVRLCCQQVEELDVRQEFEQAVKDLLQRLAVYEQLSQEFLQAKLSAKETIATNSPRIDDNAVPRDNKDDGTAPIGSG